MDISSKIANFAFAVALTVSPVSGKINTVLPYIQFAAAAAVVVNNTAQIAGRFKLGK